MFFLNKIRDKEKNRFFLEARGLGREGGVKGEER
jgi:hypothetical protein